MKYKKTAGTSDKRQFNGRKSNEPRNQPKGVARLTVEALEVGECAAIPFVASDDKDRARARIFMMIKNIRKTAPEKRFYTSHKGMAPTITVERLA